MTFALTPDKIDGAETVSTFGAECLVKQMGTKLLVLAAQGEQFELPGAYRVGWAGLGGTFEDATQKALKSTVDKLTGRDLHHPILVYCHHNECWLSHNLVIRLLKAGYDNIYWMRNGIQSWIANGLPLDRAKDVDVATPEPSPAPPILGWSSWTDPEFGISVAMPTTPTTDYRREQVHINSHTSSTNSDYVTETTAKATLTFEGRLMKAITSNDPNDMAAHCGSPTPRNWAAIPTSDKGIVAEETFYTDSEQSFRVRCVKAFDRPFILMMSVEGTNKYDLLKDATTNQFFDSLVPSKPAPRR